MHENVTRLLNGRDLDDLNLDEKQALLRAAGILKDADPVEPQPRQPLAPHVTADVAPAVPACAEVATSEADSIAYLRAHGVEVDLPEERGAPRPAPPGAGGAPFTFVHIPADAAEAVAVETAQSAGADVLQPLLAPRFATDRSMDDEVVARETAGRLKNMIVGGAEASAGALKPPSAATVAELAVGGVCEAYPLGRGSEANEWTSVKLYVDEVGALRGRPRNARAEDLAHSVGLSGLAIHGDAYVGRSTALGPAGAERNTDFGVAELSPDAPWAVEARREHMHAAAAAGMREEEALARGDHGAFEWSQTEDDVEVRVRGAPSGRGAARRVAVSYGGGTSLSVSFDGARAVLIEPLFDRVTPDECTWTLDGGACVVTMEKAKAGRPWASLSLGEGGVHL